MELVDDQTIVALATMNMLLQYAAAVIVLLKTTPKRSPTDGSAEGVGVVEDAWFAFRETVQAACATVECIRNPWLVYPLAEARSAGLGPVALTTATSVLIGASIFAASCEAMQQPLQHPSRPLSARGSHGEPTNPTLSLSEEMDACLLGMIRRTSKEADDAILNVVSPSPHTLAINGNPGSKTSSQQGDTVVPWITHTRTIELALVDMLLLMLRSISVWGHLSSVVPQVPT